jgi:hypothetical protein
MGVNADRAACSWACEVGEGMNKVVRLFRADSQPRQLAGDPMTAADITVSQT